MPIAQMKEALHKAGGRIPKKFSIAVKGGSHPPSAVTEQDFGRDEPSAAERIENSQGANIFYKEHEHERQLRLEELKSARKIQHKYDPQSVRSATRCRVDACRHFAGSYSPAVYHEPRVQAPAQCIG
jgi:hypothetical protein